MLKFFNKHKSYLGLDLNDISLKLVEIKATGKNLYLGAYSDVAVPKNVVSDGNLQNSKLLIETIQRAFTSPKSGRFTTKRVVVSIPETKSFIRGIQVPLMSAEEAKEAVPWEAEAYIPIPISQVYLDWVISEPSPLLVGAESGKNKIESQETGKGDKLTVLITAAPKNYVDDLVKIVKTAGLEPTALEVESQATVRSLLGTKRNEAVLIADIDTLRTSLLISYNSTLQFTSSIPVAGNAFTDSIAKMLTLSFEEAEQVKRDYGLGEMGGKKSDILKKALTPVLRNLVEEIKNTIHFYEEHAMGDEKISRVLLTGGSSKLKHLPSFLHDELSHSNDTQHGLRSLPGLKVELGNPWVNILQKGQTPPMSREDSLSYATAIGLALRHF